MQKLPREFYNQETSLVAKALLGHYLVHRKQGIERVGKIVETEAYLGQHDLASHSSKGQCGRISHCGFIFKETPLCLKDDTGIMYVETLI